MFINPNYFVNDINIPNLLEDTGINNNGFQRAIDEYTRIFLQNTLGLEDYNELMSHTTNGVLNNTAPIKWLNYVNGEEYTYNDKTYKWNGLIYTEGLIPKSILAYFVYINYFEQENNSGTGVKVLETKNTLFVNQIPKLVSVQNKFIELYQDVSQNSHYNTSYFKGVLFTDYYNENNNQFVTYSTYLKHKEIGNYKNCAFGINYENRFGL